jgi:hypothetical protein
MVYKIWKQGIEIEVQQISKETPNKFAEYNKRNELNEIHQGFHLDDSKTEFSSDAKETMGEMEKHLSNCMAPALEKMYNSVIPLTIGCPPFFTDYASGHVHTSVKDMENTTWVELRQKLYSAQPLIALLSQNSPLVNNLRAADVRLLLSNWSVFTDYDSVNEAHWLAVAYGRNGGTIEVRIPSSGPMFQLLAVATFIRVVLEDDSEMISVPNVGMNWQRVISYGSASLSKIAVPSSLRYDGFKTKALTVKTTDLWKIFYEDNKDKFDAILDTMSPAGAVNVRKFYEFVANGHTLSDAFYDVITNLMSQDREMEIAKALYEINLASYKNENIWNMIPNNPRTFMPIIENYCELSDLVALCDKIKTVPFDDRLKSAQKDMLEVFFAQEGLLNNRSIRGLMYEISAHNKVQARLCGVSQALIRNLVKNKVLKKEGVDLVEDENFALLAGIAKEGGLL